MSCSLGMFLHRVNCTAQSSLLNFGESCPVALTTCAVYSIAIFEWRYITVRHFLIPCLSKITGRRTVVLCVVCHLPMSVENHLLSRHCGRDRPRSRPWQRERGVCRPLKMSFLVISFMYRAGVRLGIAMGRYNIVIYRRYQYIGTVSYRRFRRGFSICR